MPLGRRIYEIDGEEYSVLVSPGFIRVVNPARRARNFKVADFGTISEDDNADFKIDQIIAGLEVTVQNHRLVIGNPQWQE